MSSKPNRTSSNNSIRLTLPTPKDKALLYHVASEVQKYLEWNLREGKSEDATRARAYLAKRGLTASFIEEVGLGYIPSGKHRLVSWAARGTKHRDPLPLEALVELGLAYRKDWKVAEEFSAADPDLRVRIRSSLLAEGERLTPAQLRDPKPRSSDELNAFLSLPENINQARFYRDAPDFEDEDRTYKMPGDYISFPVRALDKETGELRVVTWLRRSCLERPHTRYKDGQRSAIYDPSEVVLFMDEQLGYVRGSGRAIFAEGPMDALSIRQVIAAYPEKSRPAVLALGNSKGRFNDEALSPLIGSHVTLVPDDDEDKRKGFMGCVSLAKRLMARDCKINVVCVRDGWNGDLENAPKDASALLEKAGPQGVRQALVRGKDRGVVDFYIEEMFPEISSRLRYRIAALQDIAPLLALLKGEERSHGVARISSLLDLDREVVEMAMEDLGSRIPNAEAEPMQRIAPPVNVNPSPPVSPQV